jgi:hypothetical protein
MSNSNKFSRREILAAGGAIIATSLIARSATAQDRVPEDDPTAVALGYLHDAGKVDTSKWAKRAGADGAKQFCDNCALYQDTGDGWGTCSIFQGRLVKGRGWCNAWIAK